MTLEETKPITDALEDCVREIQSLRRINEVMAARLRMFDEMMCLLHSNPASPNSVAMSPDVAWIATDLVSRLKRDSVLEVLGKEEQNELADT